MQFRVCPKLNSHCTREYPVQNNFLAHLWQPTMLFHRRREILDSNKPGIFPVHLVFFKQREQEMECLT